MSRWSPTVLPQAPEAVRGVDFGRALERVADSIGARRDRKDRERKETEARDRETAALARGEEEKNYRRGQDAAALSRQTAQDADIRRDRQVRREGEFLQTKARARDEGFVGDAEGTQRREGFRAIAAGGQAMGGAMGGAMSSLGDQLRRASEAGPSTTLTRPDDTTERMQFDPTMTREARDEQRTLRIERARDAMRPPDPVPGAEHIARQEYDRKHRVGDFAPARPTGGGSGGVTRDPRLAIANTEADNAARDLSRIESRAPKPPDFSDAPVPGQKGYEGFKIDSIARGKQFTSDSNTYAKKLDTAHQRAEKWNSLSDQLSTQAMMLTGGEAVGGSQKISAQREMEELQSTFNARLAAAPKDPQTRKEMGQWYNEQATAINLKYGIRPKD